MDPTHWWAVLLDGTVGAVAATLASFFAAVHVLKKQTEHDRQRAIEDRRLLNAQALAPIVGEVTMALHDMVQMPERDDRLKTLIAVIRKLDASYVLARAIDADTIQSYHAAFDACRALHPAIEKAAQSGDDAIFEAGRDRAVTAVIECRAAVGAYIARSAGFPAYGVPPVDEKAPDLSLEPEKGDKQGQGG